MTDQPYTSDSLDNAEEIIERFGGIRPMATKIDAAVTTVQGWKKRNTIPPHRIDKIIKAAQDHNVDLTGLVDMPEPEPTPQEPPTQETPAGATVAEVAAHALENHDAQSTQTSAAHTDQQQDHDSEPSVFASMLHDDIIYSIQQAERRAVNKSTWTTIILVAVSTLALTLIFGLGSKGMSEKERIAALEEMQADLEKTKTELNDIKKKQGFFGSVIPDDLDQKVEVLKNSANNTAKKAATLANEAKVISQNLINGNSEEVMAQIQALDGYLSKLGSFPSMASVTQRFSAFTATSGGRALLEQSTSELSTVLSDLKAPSEKAIESTIDKARATSPSLQQSLEGVPATDLKAAALLLTMTQLRSALNRDGEPFNEDLALLQKLVGDDDAELQGALSKLSPHAQNGILTSAGLSNELRSLTGEIVVASLKGEDLSIQDRAKARLQSVLLLEEEGGNVTTSSQAQQTLSDADKMLQKGDLEGAISLIGSLDGNAAKVAAPWMKKAQASLEARQFKTALSGILDSRAAGLNGYSATLNNAGTGRPIYLKP